MRSLLDILSFLKDIGKRFTKVYKINNFVIKLIFYFAENIMHAPWQNQWVAKILSGLLKIRMVEPLLMILLEECQSERDATVNKVMSLDCSKSTVETMILSALSSVTDQRKIEQYLDQNFPLLFSPKMQPFIIINGNNTNKSIPNKKSLYKCLDRSLRDQSVNWCGNVLLGR